MSLNAVEWLPLHAFADHRVLDAVTEIAEDWLKTWVFESSNKDVQCQLIQPEHSRLESNSEWVSFGDGIFLQWTDNKAQQLGLAIVSAPSASPYLNAIDRALLLGVANEARSDLVARLSQTLHLARACETDGSFGRFGGIEICLTFGSAQTSLLVGIQATALVAFRKSLIRSQKTIGEFSEDLFSVVADDFASFEVRMGDAKISAGELSGLAVGDVIVLEQRIDDPVTCTRQMTGNVFLKARLARSEDGLTLRIAA